MAKDKRVFTAFAVEDKTSRDFLVGQSKHDKTPFDFIDMSAQEPWDSKWKTNCRERISGCDGVVGLISKNTAKADGALWEIACAYIINPDTNAGYIVTQNGAKGSWGISLSELLGTANKA
jgi:hypothetical protein